MGNKTSIQQPQRVSKSNQSRRSSTTPVSTGHSVEPRRAPVLWNKLAADVNAKRWRRPSQKQRKASVKEVLDHLQQHNMHTPGFDGYKRWAEAEKILLRDPQLMVIIVLLFNYLYFINIFDVIVIIIRFITSQLNLPTNLHLVSIYFRFKSVLIF